MDSDNQPDFILRDAAPGDLPALQAIYAHHVRTGLASFELEPPDLAEFTRRFEALKAEGLPYYLAEAKDGTPLGYAYAGRYRHGLATASRWRTRSTWRRRPRGAASARRCWRP